MIVGNRVWKEYVFVVRTVTLASRSHFSLFLHRSSFRTMTTPCRTRRQGRRSPKKTKPSSPLHQTRQASSKQAKKSASKPKKPKKRTQKKSRLPSAKSHRRKSLVVLPLTMAAATSMTNLFRLTTMHQLMLTTSRLSRHLPLFVVLQEKKRTPMFAMLPWKTMTSGTLLVWLLHCWLLFFTLKHVFFQQIICELLRYQ